MSKSTTGRRRAGLASIATTALVAGACFAGAGAANADANFAFTRIDGHSRYDVAAAAATKFGKSDTVIVASGEPGKYGDALAASFLSGTQKAPVLLTKLNTMPTATQNAIKASGATKVTLVGGEMSISAAQEAALRTAGLDVTRVSGHTRYDTDAAIIKAGAAKSDTALIATGEKFADALSAGPLAYAKGMPIGTVKLDDAPDAVVAQLKASGITKAIVLGGDLSVSQKVIDKLESNGITVTKQFDGGNRGEVSTMVADYAIANEGFSATRVNVATGREGGDGADALAGGPLSGQENRAILVTKSGTVVGSEVDAFLKAHANTLTGTDNYIFGGLLSVTQAMENQMEADAQTVTSNQTYTVSPQSSTSVTVSDPAGTDAQKTQGNVKYTVTGLSADKVDIALVDPNDVKVDANGQVTFKSSGTAGQADLKPGQGGISVVNGVATGGGTTADGIAPNNGSVNFTVDSQNIGSAVPVVYSAADGNDVLELDSTTTSSSTYGTPKGAFGVGGEVTWTASAAPTNNNATLAVSSVDTAAKTFQANDGTNDYTYTYGAAGSSYTYLGVNGTHLSESQFAADLSAGDTLTANYNASGPSTFQFTTDKPAAPTGVTAAYDATKGVTVSWTKSPNQDVVSYTVNRYKVASDGTVSTTADDTVTTGNVSSYTDTTATSGSYQYTVTANGSAGNGSSVASDNSATVTVPAGADKTAPSAAIAAITNGSGAGNNGASIDNGDQIALTFSEKATLADNASFTLHDADGSVGTIVRGGNASMTLNSAGTTVFITLTGNPVPEEVGGTAGLDATEANETVSNSSGVADTSGNALAEVNATATSTALTTFTVDFNSPVDMATVADSDFIVPSGNSVASVVWSNGDKTATVTLTTAGTAGQTVGLKANSVSNTDGGNGPAVAATDTL